jgi:alpha-L-rhamnosidase
VATFDTGLTDGDWRADWIRRKPEDLQDITDQYTYARKEFTLGSSPIVRARAYVSADQQYELYINGTRVGKGEAYSYPDHQYYETLDVTQALRAGAANAVGMLTYWDGATKGHPAGKPGMILHLSIQHQDGASQVITTDGTWRVRRGAWLPGTQRDLEGDQVDYTENINGPAEPIGWNKPGFDDHTWQPAVVIGRHPVALWTHLVSVRTRIVQEPVRAVSLTRLASGAVIADFGQVFAAVPTVTFHNGVAGKKINMHAGYLLEPDGQVSTIHGTQHTDMSYSYIERGGTETFQPFDYLGFRYLQINDPGERLTTNDVVALTRHAAVPDENAATFTSSDPTVDAIFQLGRHSALFTAQEQFIDTPTREKGPWLWDGFNESVTAMDAFGEQNLTRKSLLEFAASQARYWQGQGRINKIYPTGLGALDIAEFSEIYAEWVWQYWIHTSDVTLLRAVYPALSNLSDYIERAIVPATGLVTNLPATNLYSPLPVLTRQNVLGVNAFRRTGDVAEAIGRPPVEVNTERARQAALTSAINARLTRADGTYVDGLDTHGRQSGAAEDSNTVAVVYGVVPPAHLAAVAAYVNGLGMASEPRDAAEILETLRQAGRFGDLLHILDDRNADGWSNILARGGTFTWEVWEPIDANGDSMSHGWGSNVLVEIQEALLGVHPTGPGYATFAVDPPTSGLTSASGLVPTPSGPIQVSWNRSTPIFTLDVTVPPNTTASVSIPAATVASVTEGGRALAGDPGIRVLSAGSGVVQLAVSAGTYVFSAAPS